MEGEQLTPDEVYLLDAWRELRALGTGSLYIEMAQHRCSKFETKAGALAQRMNHVLGVVAELRD